MKSKYLFPFVVMGIVCCLGLFYSPEQPVADPANISAADIAWMLTASGLVLLMTPGLSFFYGGMVSKKNIISTMLQSFIATGLISVLWIVIGFGLAFGPSIGGIIGNPSEFFMMRGINGKEAWS